MNKPSMFDLIPYCMYCKKQNTGRGFGQGTFHFWCMIKNFFTRKYEKDQEYWKFCRDED